MIIYFHWHKKRIMYDGWFLFGIIPLYVRRIDPDSPRLRRDSLKQRFGQSQQGRLRSLPTSETTGRSN